MKTLATAVLALVLTTAALAQPNPEYELDLVVSFVEARMGMLDFPCPESYPSDGSVVCAGIEYGGDSQLTRLLLDSYFREALGGEVFQMPWSWDERLGTGFYTTAYASDVWIYTVILLPVDDGGAIALFRRTPF